MASVTFDSIVGTLQRVVVRGRGVASPGGAVTFVITAEDGRPDRIRVQIWSQATGALLYDNLRGIDGPGTQLTLGTIAVTRVR